MSLILNFKKGSFIKTIIIISFSLLKMALEELLVEFTFSTLLCKMVVKFECRKVKVYIGEVCYFWMKVVLLMKQCFQWPYWWKMGKIHVWYVMGKYHEGMIHAMAETWRWESDEFCSSFGARLVYFCCI